MPRNVSSHANDDSPESDPNKPVLFEGETLRHSPHLFTLLRKRLAAYLDD